MGSNRFTNRVKDNVTVRGKVTDDLGETLPGVSVVVKGTATGTSTNEKGDFALDAPDNAVLVFTFIGYTNEEIAINGRTTINVTLMPDIKALSEVVVVGYGTQKKVSVTGAVAQTEGKVIKTAPVPAISNALVGRLPGLIGSNTTGEPGYDDASILIRGASTTGNSAPLVVVDGVPDRAGGFSWIDANDVESVTILKDASANIFLRPSSGRSCLKGGLTGTQHQYFLLIDHYMLRCLRKSGYTSCVVQVRNKPRAYSPTLVVHFAAVK